MNVTRAVIGCCLLLASTVMAYADVAIRTVALSGTQALGTPAGTEFLGFTEPTINNAGQVAFKGILQTEVPSPIWNYGIWSEGSGSLALLAAEGMQAPGAPEGTAFVQFYDPQINNAGQVAFVGLVSPQVPGALEPTGVWSQGTGDLSLVALIGQEAPGMPSGTMFANGEDLGFRFNHAGQTALLIGLQREGANVRSTIWVEEAGTLELIAEVGKPAAGIDSGNYRSIPGGALLLNGNGQIAFFSLLDSPPIAISTLDSAAWVSTNGTLSLAARAGTPAPGMASAMVLSYPGITGFNNAGQFVLSAGTFVADEEGWFISGSQGLWTNRSGDLALLVQRGDTAPGTADEKFARIGGSLINSQGQIVFACSLESETGNFEDERWGIWTEGPNGFELVALEGEPVPGAATGVVYRGLGQFAINGSGDIIFGASFGTPDSWPRELEGGWLVRESEGQLEMLLSTGDEIEVSPGDFRTVDRMGARLESGGEDGRAIAFNDDGALAFYAYFTDNSVGVFTAQLAGNAIPEPSGLLLLALGTCGVIAARSCDRLF
ncbi:DUF7453 family protein [Aeoliella sp. SH292]|uniref:DUF7453 family protein n=1 Tax=Aeoliella sp. SH292 TaxID=3454464 RepID=UPI003F99F64C